MIWGRKRSASKHRDREHDNDRISPYQIDIRAKLAEFPDDRDLAFARSIGAESIASFERQGDDQVAALLYHGLRSGMSIYDLGCGCGRTAQALQRAGWSGQYLGADIVDEFVDELQRKCPGFEAIVHLGPTIAAADCSLDLLFHWSVFTHISPEECFLYLQDSFRALKPGGRLVFSFVEIGVPPHFVIFRNRADQYAHGLTPPILDTFLHRDWVKGWAELIGYREVAFTDGDDDTHHPPLWQSLATMVKP